MAMNFQRYTATGRVSVGDVKRTANNAWTNVNDVYAKENGVWVKVWQRAPEYPDMLSLPNMGFTQVGGAGEILFGDSAGLYLQVHDSEYSGAVGNSDVIQLYSATFTAASPKVMRFNYYMEGNYHKPYLQIYIKDGSRLINYPYTNKVTPAEINIESTEPIQLMIHFGMTEKGDQTSKTHITTLYLGAMTINGQAMKWK